jgi:hypothetical protein
MLMRSPLRSADKPPARFRSARCSRTFDMCSPCRSLYYPQTTNASPIC